MKNTRSFKILFTAIAISLANDASFGEQHDDAARSEAAVYSGKIVWDLKLAVTMRDAIDNIKAIRRTYDELVKHHVDVDMVIAVRAISKYRVAEAKKRDSMAAQSLIKQHNAILMDLLNRPGVKTVSDASILDLIEDRNLRNRVEIVDNVFLRLNEYHQKGYFIIPMH